MRLVYRNYAVPLPPLGNVLRFDRTHWCAEVAIELPPDAAPVPLQVAPKPKAAPRKRRPRQHKYQPERAPKKRGAWVFDRIEEARGKEAYSVVAHCTGGACETC